MARPLGNASPPDAVDTGLDRHDRRVIVAVSMAKAKSEPVREMDALQAALKPDLKRWGFRSRARGYNRATSDGLTQVIEFQMGRFDPPGTSRRLTERRP